MKVYRYVLLSKRDTEIYTLLDFLMTSGYPDIKVDKLHILFIKYVIIWYFICDEKLKAKIIFGFRMPFYLPYGGDDYIVLLSLCVSKVLNFCYITLIRNCLILHDKVGI